MPTSEGGRYYSSFYSASPMPDHEPAPPLLVTHGLGCRITFDSHSVPPGLISDICEVADLLPPTYQTVTVSIGDLAGAFATSRAAPQYADAVLTIGADYFTLPHGERIRVLLHEIFHLISWDRDDVASKAIDALEAHEPALAAHLRDASKREVERQATMASSAFALALRLRREVRKDD